MIYLDNNATTALDPAVYDEMRPWLGGAPCNPSSIHAFGQEARRAVDRARVKAARLIGAMPEEIVFTGGGTEADNLAILGAAAASRKSRPHIVTTLVEHQSVLNPCRHIERNGGMITFLPVDCEGRLKVDIAHALMREDMILASVMLANNDIGTEQPVAEISSRTRELGILLHTDAVQAVGKIPVDVNALGVDLLSFSAHKLHGPQGIGALYVRSGTQLSPIVFGGHQERGLRPGTENVAAIVGFGKACELAAARLEEDAVRLLSLRSLFETEILRRISGVAINGAGASRLPNTSNLSTDGLDGEMLTINLDLLGLAVSTGSACSASDHEPSHVLIAMGRTEAEARSSVRVSFGRENNTEEVTCAADLFVQAVDGMRNGFR